MSAELVQARVRGAKLVVGSILMEKSPLNRGSTTSSSFALLLKMMTRNLVLASFARLGFKVRPGFTLMMSLCTTTMRAVRIQQTANSRSLINKRSDLVEPGRTLAHDAVESTARGDKMCSIPSVIYVTRGLESSCVSVYTLITYLNYILNGFSCFTYHPHLTIMKSFHAPAIRSDFSVLMRIDWQKVSELNTHKPCIP